MKKRYDGKERAFYGLCLPAGGLRMRLQESFYVVKP